MININEDRCFICKQPVLGLIGQDTLLDTYRLSRSPEDNVSNELLEANAFGECHLLCLIKSKWGKLWARKITEHLISEEGLLVFSRKNEYTYLVSKKFFRMTIIKENGWMTEIDNSQIGKIRVAEPNIFLPVSHISYFDLSSQPNVTKALEEKLSKNKELALLEFIKMIGIENRLFNPKAIDNGMLKFADNEALNTSLLEVKLTYEKSIPFDLFNEFLRFVKQ